MAATKRKNPLIAAAAAGVRKPDPLRAVRTTKKKRGPQVADPLDIHTAASVSLPQRDINWLKDITASLKKEGLAVNQSTVVKMALRRLREKLGDKSGRELRDEFFET